MQILINIDETDKREIDKLLKGRGLLLLDNAQLLKRAVLAIFHGKPLPEGHGDLIDINNIDVIELEDSTHIIKHEKGDEVDVYISAPIIIKAN